MPVDPNSDRQFQILVNDKKMAMIRTRLSLRFILGVALILLAILFYLTRRTNTTLALDEEVGKQTATVSKANTTEHVVKSADKLHDVTRHLAEIQRAGLPRDYFERDYIKDNDLVDKLVPLLNTHIDVIEETQRIQYSMFKSLIGKFKYAMLFNYASFENKGDPAITVGELRIIRKLGIELVFHCETTSCKNHSLTVARNISKQYNSENLVILMHGGGNLLCYVFEDYHRKMVLETFPDFNVVLFPQSLWQDTTPEITREFQTVYSKHKYLTFLYRDRNSYNLGKKLFPEVKSFLMPDMAFQIGEVQRFIIPTHDIMWLKRGDKESMQHKIPTGMHGRDVIVQDWWGWKTPRTDSRLEDPIMIAANGMMFLQRGRVVITDRLHGHILSVLCGLPHVVLDPANKKITSFMQSWTGGIDNILVANSAEEALIKAGQLLSKLDNKLPETLAFRK